MRRISQQLNNVRNRQRALLVIMHAVEKRVTAVQTAKELALREIQDFHDGQVADIQRQVSCDACCSEPPLEICLTWASSSTNQDCGMHLTLTQVEKHLRTLLSQKNELATKSQELEGLLLAIEAPLRSR